MQLTFILGILQFTLFTLPFLYDVQSMTFWYKLRRWPVITLTYIEKFDSVTVTSQINLPDVHPMTFGHKLRHLPIVTLTYIGKFESVIATGQINFPVGCQPYLYLLSFSTLTTSSGQLCLSCLTCITRYLNLMTMSENNRVTDSDKLNKISTYCKHL